MKIELITGTAGQDGSYLSDNFCKVYENNSWGDSESRSGEGSNLEATKTLRRELPYLFKKYNIKSMLDIPCGDFNWMRQLDLSGIEYMGGDIVEDLIKNNTRSDPEVEFRVMNILTDDLPCVDLILCRDLLVHLSNANIHSALKNIYKSGSKYLLSTTFTRQSYRYRRGHSEDIGVENGDWRPINLLIEPFFLRPIYLINEDCRQDNPIYNDKCLILFDLSKV